MTLTPHTFDRPPDLCLALQKGKLPPIFSLTEWSALMYKFSLQDGGVSTMTYLPTKRTFVLGRGNERDRTGLWFLYMTRIDDGQYLLVSADDKHMFEDDSMATVAISDHDKAAECQLLRAMVDSGNEFGNCHYDMDTASGFAPNLGPVRESRRRFTLGDGRVGGATYEFSALVYHDRDGAPVHSISNYYIGPAMRPLVAVVTSVPAHGVVLDSDVHYLQSFLADSVLCPPVHTSRLVTASGVDMSVTVDSVYDSPVVRDFFAEEATPALCATIRRAYRGGAFRRQQELLDAYSHMSKRHMKFLFANHKTLAQQGLRAGDCHCDLCMYVQANNTFVPSSTPHDFYLAPHPKGTVWAGDLFRSRDTPDVCGNHTGLKLVERTTGFYLVYPLSTKHGCYAQLQHFVCSWATAFGIQVRKLFFDRDTMLSTYSNAELKTKEAKAFETATGSFIVFAAACAPPGLHGAGLRTSDARGESQFRFVSFAPGQGLVPLLCLQLRRPEPVPDVPRRQTYPQTAVPRNGADWLQDSGAEPSAFRRTRGVIRARTETLRRAGYCANRDTAAQPEHDTHGVYCACAY